jgi:hypothetical protein
VRISRLITRFFAKNVCWTSANIHVLVLKFLCPDTVALFERKVELNQGRREGGHKIRKNTVALKKWQIKKERLFEGSFQKIKSFQVNILVL